MQSFPQCYPQWMALAILSVVGVVSVAALIWFAKVQVRVVLRTIREHQPPDIPAPVVDEAKWRSVDSHLGMLQERMERLTKAVAEGIEHVDRNEKRVRGIITGAQRRFEAEGYADPGVEAEADTLPVSDAEVSTGEGLSALPDDVEATANANPFQGVPGNVPLGFDGAA